jgi:hypothetical protein
MLLTWIDIDITWIGLIGCMRALVGFDPSIIIHSFIDGVMSVVDWPQTIFESNLL